MTDAELDALWDDFCEAANPNGSTENGAIDLYDIDGMVETARNMWDAITYLRSRDALGAVVMQERAADMLDAVGHPTPAQSPVHMARQYAKVLREYMPTNAELLAHALELPEIKALVDEVRRFNARVISGEVRSTKTFNAFCNALAALEPK